MYKLFYNFEGCYHRTVNIGKLSDTGINVTVITVISERRRVLMAEVQELMSEKDEKEMKEEDRTVKSKNGLKREKRIGTAGDTRAEI